MHASSDDDPEYDGDLRPLVPRGPTFLGLKVADKEQAQTVRQVGIDVLGLLVLISVHFVLARF